jgi:hypothetical protein
MRNRIFDVFRFGTPMSGHHKSTSTGKKQITGHIRYEGFIAET